MVRRTYRANSGKSRRKTYRRPIPGGSIESVEKLLTDTPIGTVNIINPESKFVVATYWWGEKNMNRNLQSPCPEDITDMVKVAVAKEYGKNYGFPAHLVASKKAFKKIRALRGLTTAENEIVQAIQKEWDAWLSSLMAKPELKEFITKKTAEFTAQKTGETGKPARSFPDMIKEWEAYCKKANVNYIALHTEFPREDYQNAINGKPLFIKKVLDAVAPRAVLYIDGDMWMLKYPHIFDIDNVDFMARGWNTDPRSKPKSLVRPAYDPYIFETSGGTMYFGNTQAARNVLDEWAAESAKPEQKGKADDRILSQVFTMDTMILGTNLINLPIEYLWLTDNYQTYLKTKQDPASLDDAYIEHHYCLTGEERAAGQGAAVNREPEGYEQNITEMINYKRPPELLYEYIFFDEDYRRRDGFARYLWFMRTTKNWFVNRNKQGEVVDTKDDSMLKIVDFQDVYGEFNEIAKTNLEAAGLSFPQFSKRDLTESEAPAQGPVEPVEKLVAPREMVKPEVGQQVPIGPGGPQQARRGGAERVTLALTSPISEILKALAAGSDVHMGEEVNHGPEDECVVYDASTREDGINEYTRKLRVDTMKPMFFSAKSKVLFHLLAMCATLADINNHINGSYMFMSRIRWRLLKSGVIPPINVGVDFKPVVHQIWFGGEMPAWRNKIFADNELVCKQHGFQYKLWRNEDRDAIQMKKGEDGSLHPVLDDKGKTISVHFPQTYAYQQTALQVGRDTGQGRWAQVADLARLEIVYNNSGIYVDSIIEISPAFLLAVVKAINGGATFVGCNEDKCDPPLDCKNGKGEMYLSNSFFAATRASPLFKELLSFDSLDNIDFGNHELNHTTGPYFLRAGIEKVKSEIKITLFDSEQIYMYNKQETPYKEPHPDRFLTLERLPGAFKFTDNPPAYYIPGGIKLLQSEFLESKGVKDGTPEFEKMEEIVKQTGPLAIYHSGLGGTWSL